jgi:hypothetical protein
VKININVHELAVNVDFRFRFALGLVLHFNFVHSRFGKTNLVTENNNQAIKCCFSQEACDDDSQNRFTSVNREVLAVMLSNYASDRFTKTASLSHLLAPESLRQVTRSKLNVIEKEPQDRPPVFVKWDVLRSVVESFGMIQLTSRYLDSFSFFSCPIVLHCFFSFYFLCIVVYVLSC